MMYFDPFSPFVRVVKFDLILPNFIWFKFNYMQKYYVVLLVNRQEKKC